MRASSHGAASQVPSVKLVTEALSRRSGLECNVSGAIHQADLGLRVQARRAACYVSSRHRRGSGITVVNGLQLSGDSLLTIFQAWVAEC
jgi:hypothetical protein